VSWILSKVHRNYDKVYLLSRTIDVQPNNWDFIPGPNKILGFDPDRITGIITSQEKAIADAREEIQKAADATGHTPRGPELEKQINKLVPHVLLVLDDIIDDPRVYRDSTLSRLFVSGRHLRMSLFFLSQTPARSGSINRTMRSNVDYCMCSEFDTLDDLETIAGLFFAKEGKKAGIARIAALTDEKHRFAVSQVHIRGKKSLADHTCSIMAPASLPRFKLKETREAEAEAFAYAARQESEAPRLVGVKRGREGSGPRDVDSGHGSRYSVVDFS
jgi:hypothetical protein